MAVQTFETRPQPQYGLAGITIPTYYPYSRVSLNKNKALSSAYITVNMHGLVDLTNT